jgi:thiol-disulfide isomerase/thioredoxin
MHRQRTLQQNRSNALLRSTSSNSQDDGMAGLMGADLRGKPAPSFTLKAIDGRKVSLADHRGRAVVINFWATYCGPCKLEMPWFEQLEAKYRNQGLVILGIDQDEGAGQTEISMAAKHAGVSYPILMPDDAVSKNYGGVDYLPETFYINRKGIVVMQTAGAPTENQIEANIRSTLAAGN